MTKIRTSCHAIKFANTGKQNNLSLFINEYRRASSILIDYLWEHGYSWNDKDNITQYFNINENKLALPSMLTSDIIYKSNIQTFLTGRAMKCCLTQVSGMIRAETEKQRKRIYMLNKLKNEKTSRKQRKQLIQKLKQNIPQKPNSESVNPELNSVCCEFKNTNGEFDGFIRLTSITTTKMDIKIPIKFTRLSKKFKTNNLLTSFLISKDKIDFRWELPEIPKKNEGKIIGADQGYKDILTMSDKQVTPNQDEHGHSLESIIDK